MGSAEAIIELFALIAAVIFGYFQIIVPFMRGEVRLSKKWPFVEEMDSGTTRNRGRGQEVERIEDVPDKSWERRGEVTHLLFADLIGYIPMKLENDSLAQELLEEFSQLIRSIYRKHGGRELKVFGDEFLLGFPASIGATLCAIELQKTVSERNANEPEERKIQVRVGIHSGEVIHQENDVTGEGVEIVSHVERLAGPGGICITENVYRKVRNKAGIPILKFGRGAKKDIKAAINIYRMIMPWEKGRLTYSERLSMAFQHTGYRMLTSICAMMIFVIVFFFGYMMFSEEAESGEPIPIAVVDIVNQTGEKELDGLSGMLITALEQSRRLSVLTRSRMFDILKQLGREDVGHIDEMLGKEICMHANLDALVIASIRKFGTLYTIDLKVLDPDRDEYLFTAMEEGEGQESIPAMMDMLSERTRIGLKEKAEEIHLTSRSVAEVTTPNLEAYQHYFQGEQLVNRLKFREARDEFRKAVSLDSTFALAHYRLAYAYGWEGESIAKETLRKAIDLIDRIPDKEKYYVRAEKARLDDGFGAGIEVLREMEEIYPNDKEMIYNIGDWSFHENHLHTAIEYLDKVLEMDPTHERALQHLTWTYAGIGELEKMGETARKYILINEIEGSVILGQYYQSIGDYALAESTLLNILEVEPEHEQALMRLALLHGELGHYDLLYEYARQYSEVGPSRIVNQVLGYAYLANGNDKKALKKFMKAQELAPYDPDIPSTIAYIYMKQGFYDKAREEFETMTREDQKDNWRERGYNGLLMLDTFLGKYREAFSMSDELIEIHFQSEDTTSVGLEHIRKTGLLWAGWKDRDAVMTEIEEASRYQDHIHGLFFWGGLSHINALRGDFDQAEKIANEKMNMLRWFDPFIRFVIHSEKNEYAEARSISGPLLDSCSNSVNFIVRYYLAENQLEEGRLDEAIVTLQKLQANVGGNWNWALFYPRSIYLMGRIYEEKGELELARGSYETFLEIWKDADADLLDRIDAEERMANLEGLAVR